jgi:AcrR family transcriptional regulator
MGHAGRQAAARGGDKRGRLLEAAKALIYRQGFSQTTLADIAQESGVPLGNVYYYFKTKDDIAGAVIEDYKQLMLEGLQQLEAGQDDPLERLKAFIRRTVSHKEEVADRGCPVGSLCQELNKDGAKALAGKMDEILGVQIKWVGAQFKAAGHKDAHDRAVQLVSTLQGISLVGNAMKSPAMITRQAALLCDWVAAG